MFRTKNNMSGIIEFPIAMQDATFGFQFSEKRSAGIRSEDVERGTFQPIVFDPFDRLFEDIRFVMIEAEDEAGVDLNTVVMKYLDSPRVIFRKR